MEADKNHRLNTNKESMVILIFLPTAFSVWSWRQRTISPPPVYKSVNLLPKSQNHSKKITAGVPKVFTSQY